MSFLLEMVGFSLDLLENSSQKCSETIESLEDRIRDRAYEAENTIESTVMNRVLEGSAGYREMNFLTICHTLEKAIEDIDSIKTRMDKMEDESGVQDLRLTFSSLALSTNPAASGIRKSDMMGLDDHMMEIKGRLTRLSSNLETVSLVGMGGIGKSTLATKLYEDEYIVYHFYIRAWVTVAQDYNLRAILINLLDSMKNLMGQMREASVPKLSEFLYKSLKGSRYLIVLDDVWDTKVLDDLKRLLPNDKNGSRVLLTTRLEKVANYENSCSPHHMRFLNWHESRDLFCWKVFGKDFCPPELENIGKMIVENCRGLPLAIVVIGGLLSKAIQTPYYWSNVAKNLSSVMISNDKQISKILSLSYKNLPHHLRGCFLYMAFLPEHHNIRVTKLFKLWFAEGLLKSVKSKSMEDVAEEYLLDLVDRNLVLVHQQSSRGKIKSCKIHDLLRDLCMREAERGKLKEVTNRYFSNFRQRRVLGVGHRNILKFSGAMLEQVNLRYIDCYCQEVTFLKSLHKLPNLQTIISTNRSSTSVELCIWNMPQLRHVQMEHVFLPDPPSAGAEENSFIVLEKLQTLYMVYDLKWTLEILKRIPNLKKLGISYEQWQWNRGYYCLNNLVGLHKLESLKCKFSRLSQSSLKNIIFPTSLQKLAIIGGKFPWKDMAIVGSLPNLQVLKLKDNAFHGPAWEPNEGEFLQLKFLLLEDIYLVHWRAEVFSSVAVFPQEYYFPYIASKVGYNWWQVSLERYGNCWFAAQSSSAQTER
ncbi:putative late blight resistance protein homolog R1A-10 [Olea europaea var. sylvestris]|uniref:putative late blight resistance protein homolog R1A-10 n=1 Tax=Olea europaea var. sylvestris TaxID=158386 RepID=UPI000C1CF9A2|nr:putative late blight resistance protein homolog R1A-10 [Olea europaea var. sylvestris]